MAFAAPSFCVLALRFSDDAWGVISFAPELLRALGASQELILRLFLGGSSNSPE